MSDNQQQDQKVEESYTTQEWKIHIRSVMGSMLFSGFLLGIIFWGGFNWAMEMTNTEAFCISCHEMEENVYQEYQETIHYNNRTGVRATCPDCHVPKDWGYKILRKIRASNELFHKVIGSIDTPEKFEAKRLELAKHVWASMKASDSRECRNCHDFESMEYPKQGQRASQQHMIGFEQGQTCIDCHKGIAHSLPTMDEIDPSATVGGSS
jgi:cytochrome c-type protein NapC